MNVLYVRVCMLCTRIRRKFTYTTYTFPALVDITYTHNTNENTPKKDTPPETKKETKRRKNVKRNKHVY